VERSLLQYYDRGLAARAAEERELLEHPAAPWLTEQLGEETLERIRSEAEAKLAGLDELVEEVNQALAFDPAEAGIRIPPDPEVMVGDTACHTEPLLDTAGRWAEQTSNLIARKRY
jgi:hypothetical protein